MRLRRNKIVGLARGERSLFAAELSTSTPPQVLKLAEFVYPEMLWPASAEELGKALGRFLREQGFCAHAAVVGLPAKWVIVRQKDVPPADDATLTHMLRLSAEAEFSNDVQDLAYDYAGQLQGTGQTSVLLMATPRKYVEAAANLCDEARLTLTKITASAVALGHATGLGAATDVVVVASQASGAELIAHSGKAPNAVRHLRSPFPQQAFVNDLRRAISTLPPSASGREIVLWDGAGLDAADLSAQLRVPVRTGDIRSLGVGTEAASVNGEGPRHAAAIAVALQGVGDAARSVDFLHSRLLPPRQRRISRTAVIAGVTLVRSWDSRRMPTTVFANSADVTAKKADLDSKKELIASAHDFVKDVAFAQAWHGGDPKYLSCLRELTNALPSDEQTYATSLTVHEEVDPATGTGAAPAKSSDQQKFAVQFSGKTSDVDHVQVARDRISKMPGITDVTLGGTQDSGRGEVSFTINFTYQLPKKT